MPLNLKARLKFSFEIRLWFVRLKLEFERFFR